MASVLGVSNLTALSPAHRKPAEVQRSSLQTISLMLPSTAQVASRTEEVPR